MGVGQRGVAGARGRRTRGVAMPALLGAILTAILATLLAGCNNSPNPKGSEATNTLFIAFQERSPRHLDPTASYALNEVPYMFAVYEPPYAYHYLKRPYVLVPKSAAELATPHLPRQGRQAAARRRAQ